MGEETGSKYEYTVESSETEDERGSRFYVYYLTCFATIGGLLFGYDTGIISGSLLLIGDNWNLSTIWKELIVSATVGAAAVFSLIAGFLTDWLGRKKVVMAASVIFTGGAILMALSQDKVMLLAGRLVVGAGIGKCIGRYNCVSLLALQNKYKYVCIVSPALLGLTCIAKICSDVI